MAIDCAPAVAAYTSVETPPSPACFIELARISVPLIVDRHEAELEIGSPLLARIRTVEEHRAVHPDLLGTRVHRERIPRPEHAVGVLPGDERPDLVLEADRPRG